MTDLLGQLLDSLLEKDGNRAPMADTFQRNAPYAVVKPTYNTSLPDDKEASFQNWVKQNNIPFDPSQIINDYDMRGFYQGLQNGDPVAKRALDPNDNLMHFPDKWKTPYHETFSKQSMYAMGNAPDWVGDKLIAPDGTVIFDDAKQGGK